jgi:recombination protein RecR
MNNLEPVEKLTLVLGRLPGVGRRSAERMALKLARDTGNLVRDLLGALQDVESKVRTCSLCGGLTLRSDDPCALCKDSRRDGKLLCVVEDPGDILLLERAGEFRGRYHALMGKLSPMRGEGAENPRIEALLKRIEREGFEEVILALGSDVESDATASYLQHLLAPSKVRVSRLAFGIPAGSEIAYSDPVTLSRAIQGRRPV